MSIKVAVIIPFKNCLEYTKQALATLESTHTLIPILIDDYSDGETKAWLETVEAEKIIDPSGSTGLSYNWNLGIKRAMELGADFMFLPNNDVIFHPQTMDILVERLKKGDVVMTTGANLCNDYPNPMDIRSNDLSSISSDNEQPHPDFSCFMITKETIETIGWFDEHFERGYFEDNDYHARIVLSGNTAMKVGRAIYYHFGSRTTNQTPQYASIVQQSFISNSQYFARKWGRTPAASLDEMRATYWQHPFNDPSKTIKDW